MNKIKIEFELSCETGLMIGSGKDSIRIGDVDNPVIRQGLSGEPYIPGSSLKGKLRSLMQIKYGEKNQDYYEGSKISLLFGSGNKKIDNVDYANPSKLIVRDAYLSNKDMLEASEYLNGDLTEIKSENTINRVTGVSNPRQMERIPAGAKFRVEFIINTHGEDSEQLKAILYEAIELLEDDYLGGSGSRGYGKVSFNKVS
jgi:CRISPR-associated protein Csm3